MLPEPDCKAYRRAASVLAWKLLSRSARAAKCRYILERAEEFVDADYAQSDHRTKLRMREMDGMFEFFLSANTRVMMDQDRQY